MKHAAVETDQAPRPLARYSQGIRAGDLLFVQGMIALDPATGALVPGGIEAQTRRVIDSIRAVLAAGGLTLRDVVKVVAYLADLGEYATFNRIYNDAFSADPPPVRTTVQAALPLGARVEIEVTACGVAQAQPR